MQDTFRLSYFKSVKDTEPDSVLSLYEVAQAVRNCPQLRKQTDYICTQHRAGILDGFKTIEKGNYQDDKAATLPAILPAGQITSRAPAIHSLKFNPSGLLCLDIDENEPAELRKFYKDVQAGKFSNVALAFLSVSGALNGSFSMFMRVELPTAFKGIPSKIRKRLQLDKNEQFTATLDKINKGYHLAFRYLLKKNASITAGKAGQSLKNVRYLSADPLAYLNDQAEQFTLRQLAAALEQTEQAEQIKGFSIDALDIDANTWIGFAEQFAEQKGYQLKDGQKHLFLNRFAIAANLLGVPRDQVEDYATAKGIVVTGNPIKTPYLKYKKSFGMWAGRLEQNKRTSIVKGNAGQKLTELLQPEQIFNKWLIAPTGSGKTYFVNSIPGRKVIICPTLALVRNVCKEYGAEPFTGKSKALEAIKTADFIATTYASFRKLSAYLWEHRQQIRIFIDEAHNTSSATSQVYQLEQLTDVLHYARQFKSLTLLTGTYIYNHCPQLREMERLTVEIPRAEKQLIYTDAKDTLKAAALAIRESISAGRTPLVLFDNANKSGRLGTLQSLLSDLPGIKYFSSHTKKDEDFKKLVSNGQINPDVTGIVTTSVFKEGNNIYNECSFDIIILGHYHSAEIEQFSNRPRNAKDIKINIIRSERRETATRFFNPVFWSERLERSTLEACNELNDQDAPQCGTDANFLEFKGRQTIKVNPIKQDESGAYKVDYLQLSNIVFFQQKTAENRNEALQLRNLAKYGITHQVTTTSAAEQTAKEKRTAKASREAQQAAELEQYNEALDQLATKADPLAYATEQINRNSRNLGKIEKAVLSRFKALREIVPNDSAIIEQLRSIGAKKAKFVLLRKRLVIASLYLDADYLATNRKFVIVLKAIAAVFKDNRLLSSSEIAEKLRSCLALDKSFNLDYLEQDKRKDRYFNIAKLFFDIERKDQRNEAGEKVIKYEICTLSFEGLFIKQRKVRVQDTGITTTDLLTNTPVWQ